MANMQVEWVGSSRQDVDNKQADPSRLINCYRENIGTKMVLKAVPGTMPFVDVDGVFTRAMAEVNNQIFASIGGDLYRITSQGDVNSLGALPNSAITNISSNNTVVTVAAGGDYHTWDGTTFSAPDTGAFDDVGSVEFIGQRTVITELGGRRISWSDIADPNAFDGLNFASAEQRDDNILRAAPIGGLLVIFKEKSIERWFVTGSADSTGFLAYQPGSLVEIGLKAFGLYTEVPNGGFFVGSDNIAYLMSGGSMQPVSSRAVETALAQGKPDRAFYYESEGHKFCVLRFDDRPAWVYDMSMNEWHERADGARLDQWSAVESVKAFGDFFVGTRLGTVLRLRQNNKDVSGPLRRIAVSRTARMGGEFFSIDAIEVQATVGFVSLPDVAPDANAPEREPIITLRLSKDRGVTWSREREKGLGKLGQYDRVVKWRALGVLRNAVVEISTSEEAEISLEAIADVAVS